MTQSIFGATERPAGDLTARARIRDAALDRFAAVGFDAASIRGIADAAGVSPGLVQHHFGSKEGLRRACDEAVLEQVRTKLRAAQTGDLTNPRVLGALYAAAPPLLRYVARSVVDASPAGASLLDEMTSLTETWLSATWPERFPQGSRAARDAAVVLVAQSVGTLVLHGHVARLMGLEPWRDILSPRIGLAQLEVYEALGGFVASGWGDEIRRLIAEDPRRFLDGASRLDGDGTKERSDG
jgi:AcrR family transcriptional regulator